MGIYATLLERILPTGVTVYVAMLTTPPDYLGTHEGEPTAGWYARKPHSVWASHTDGIGWYLSNTGSIVSNAVAGSAIDVPAWGIYDALVAGNLLASGPVLDAFGQPTNQHLNVGDQMRWLDDTLRIRGGA